MHLPARQTSTSKTYLRLNNLGTRLRCSPTGERFLATNLTAAAFWGRFLRQKGLPEPDLAGASR